MLPIILVLCALTIFIIYNALIREEFDFPWSLSESYYLLENYHKNYGWFFTAFMVIMASLLLPSWISISDAFTDWRSNFTFLGFISAASMVFVGFAPRYKDEESVIHTVAAIICAVSALLWNFIVGWSVYYIPMLVVIIPIIFASVTKTWKSSREYWLEMIAFSSTFSMVITFGFINYFNC